MKRFLLISLLSFGLLAPLAAQADHHQVFISAVLKISSTSCAIELEIFEDNQNGFEDGDTIQLNGNELVDFDTLVNAGINNAGGNNDDDDTILATSTSFTNDEGITGDLIFDDSHCVNIDDDVVIAFFIEEDQATPVDSIDTSILSGFGGDNTAITKTSLAATPRVHDLESDELVVNNNNGVSASVGEDTNADDSTSLGLNCSLTPQAKRDIEGLPLLLAAFAMTLMLLRGKTSRP